VKRANGPFLIALLLEKGADPTIEYSHGWSSAHILSAEDASSELLPVMLSRFKEPFDAKKPRGSAGCVCSSVLMSCLAFRQW